MRFEFAPCPTLPRLAWCARLERDRDVVRVFHGAWVETLGHAFVEGAWTGAFERAELERARFLVGSGGVLRDGRALFCSQSDLIERLHAVRVGRELFVSNSLVFLLAMTDDELDPTDPFYCHQLRAHFRDGIRRKRKTLHTRRGRRVELHDHCQLAVGRDLRTQRIEKPAFPEPTSYAHYVALLEGVLAEVLANADSPARRQRFTALATVSGGYDSNALAVLLARLGVREALALYDGSPDRDSGAKIARRLGMSVHEQARAEFRSAPGVDEAEFLAGPRGADVVLGPSEARLVGRLLAIGRFGDVVFGLDPARRLGHFRTTRDNVIAGDALLEFRLRVGFLNFNPLYSAGLHVAALHAIASSPELAAWRIGGDYDRPIPRRILEEAGIPRAWFGVRKAATAAIALRSPADLSRAAREDFERYRRALPRPGWWRCRRQRGLVKLRSRGRKLARSLASASPSAARVAEALIPVPRRFERISEMDFSLHWGHARVRVRYAEAVARSRADAGGAGSGFATEGATV